MPTPLQQFLRTALSRRGLRAGFARARTQLTWQQIPQIVKALARNPVHRTALAAVAFPRNYDEFRNVPRLDYDTPANEFMWTAAVLGLFTDRLNDFVRQRESFYDAFFHSRYDEAARVLQSIEETFGVSLWLMSRRLQLLQLQHGLKAQKDYLERTIYAPHLNTFAAWLAYFFSLRSEENISYAALQSEVQPLLDGSALADYALHHVLPYESAKIVEAKRNVNWAEPYPIIDRYEIWAAMARLEVAKGGVAAAPYLCSALNLIEGVSDPALSGLRYLYGMAKRPAPSAFDAYAEGRYEECVPSAPKAPELAARAAVITNPQVVPFHTGSLKDQVMGSMKEMLLLGPNYQSALLHLKKLALTTAGMPISTQIAAFVERTHDNIHEPEMSVLDGLSAVVAENGNPWDLSALAQMSGRDELVAAFAEHPLSTSLALLVALGEDVQGASQRLDHLRIPSYRRALYEGHIALKHREYRSAAEHYTAAADGTPDFVSSRARSYLFRSIFSSGDISSAVRIAAQHCLRNAHAFRIYPVTELISEGLKVHELRVDVHLAVLLYLAARNIHPKWDRELSDVYEGVLFAQGVNRPSALAATHRTLGRDQLVFFLRNICVPRVMDDTVEFESVEAVDEERILVCQQLVELDPNSKSEYANEIKIVTREAEIHRILKQVESSKIYVDEDGVRGALEDLLAPAYERYRNLLGSPVLSYQTEKITRRIGELLGDNAPADLKNIRLPATEQESLFTKMLMDFLDRFALSPAYGLDTHMSTTIRHGAFEGHVRTPLASHGLLLPRVKGSQEHTLSRKWLREYEHAGSDTAQAVRSLLSTFTSSVESLIEQFQKEKLRVRTDQTPIGLFRFDYSVEERAALMASVSDSTSYDDLVERLFSFAWVLTDRSLSQVRKELQGSLLDALNGSFERLAKGIQASVLHDELGPLSNSVTLARTGLHAAINNVCNWFYLPRDLARDPFEIDLTIDVALKQIQNCYVNSKLHPSVVVETGRLLPGNQLDGWVEVFFIFLQNIILRSGYGDDPRGVAIRVSEVSGQLRVVISNELAADLELAEIRRMAAEAEVKYERDTAMRLARVEGGSGLSKVWRILEHDIRRPHRLELEVFDNFVFQARLFVDAWRE